MSLPWLRDDYKRPESRSRSRSSSASRNRQRSEDKRAKSRSRSPRSNSRDHGRGRDTAKGKGDKGRRRRSSSSSASSKGSNSSTTRLVASSRPKYVNARIFVANINSKDISKAEIVTHFEKYGNVVDCLIHPKNYVFVQFLKEEHAKLAVEGENGSTLKGFRMDVKMANENRKSGGQGNRREPPGGRHNEPGGRPPRDRGDRGDRDRDPYGPDPFIRDRRPPPHFPPSGEFGMRDPYFPPDPYRRDYHDPWMPPEDPFRRDPFADPYRDPYAGRAPPPPPPAVPLGPVECEVFIVNPQLRTYGEIIERNVKDQSIITALSVIPEGRTAPQMVEELSVKGGLFAIFLNAQNEMHRSLTLNILHGTPQEHRNMPTDDAIGLIGRSFEKYVEDLRAKANSSSAPAASSGASGSRVFLPPSSEVTYLLNLLADNRALTVAELDIVIKYLQERRDKLIDTNKRPIVGEGEKEIKPERASSETSSKASESKKENEVQSTHEELTKKILSIFQGVDPSIASKLTQSSSSVAQVPAPRPAPPPAPAEKPSSSRSNSGAGANLINFDNPNVQKALNNLIQSGPDLLKSFTSSSDATPPPPSSSAGLMSNASINCAPPLSSPGPVNMMMGNSQGIPTSHAMGMAPHQTGEMTPHQASEMAMAMGMAMHGGGEMPMGMFGPQHQYDNNLAALTAANLAAFNMHGMQAMGAMSNPDYNKQAMEAMSNPDFNKKAMGAMGNQDYNNYGPMPPMGRGGGQPPPPPPNQMY